MRYEKFLLEDGERPELPKDGHEGLNSIHFDISEVEQCEYRNQNKLLECLHTAMCELLDIDNMELQTDHYSNSFFIITTHETDFNCQKGFISPELSRKKLMSASAVEISGAIIDLILNRKTWAKKMSYSKLFV